MTLDTSTIINNKSYSKRINKIRHINNNVVPKFIFLENKVESPIYLLNNSVVTSNWNYEIRKVQFGITLRNISKINLIYDNFEPIKSFTSVFKDCFINSSLIHTFKVNNNLYYVGKGIILDSNFIPLLLITTILETNEEVSEYRNVIFEARDTTVYISRKIYSERFQEENKKLYKVLFTDIIPSIMDIEDIKIKVKSNLDIFKSIEIDSSKSIEQFNREFSVNNYNEFEQELISKLS